MEHEVQLSPKSESELESDLDSDVDESLSTVHNFVQNISFGKWPHGPHG